jgi:hypothetical protein
MQLSCKIKQYALPMKCYVRVNTITSNQNCTVIPVSDLNSYIKGMECNTFKFLFPYV